MSQFLSGRLTSQLAADQTLGVIWLSLGSAAIAEIAAHAGAGALVFDLQHGLWERSSFEAAVGLVASTVPVIARVAENSDFAIGSALDAGADGVLVPMVETAEQAEAAVAAARFPPRGRRSGGGVRPLVMGFSSYLERAEKVAVGVMIETASGVAAAEAIAAVPGLDFILIGSGDLSISYAASGGGTAEFEDGCRHVRTACARAGLPSGIFTAGVRKAAERRDEGYRLVVLANDIDVVNDSFMAAVRGFGDKT